MFDDKVRTKIAERRWLITGAAGFIGSHLVESLLKYGATVVGIDNFATGRGSNLTAVKDLVGKHWNKFTFVQGDLRDLRVCKDALGQVDVVLHQAALGSVPRSIANPSGSISANVDGFAVLLQAARDVGLSRIVFASSSSVYGNNQAFEKEESLLPAPRSPYAVSKLATEQLAAACAELYGGVYIGLRYFNVFGPRQDPNGVYAAVIPRWLAAMERGEPCVIHGDGSTSRDFCFIENVIQANIRAALVDWQAPRAEVLNVAVGDEMNLLELHGSLAAEVAKHTGRALPSPIFTEFRKGDVLRSRASIQRARELIGYNPSVTAREGIVALVTREFGSIRN